MAVQGVYVDEMRVLIFLVRRQWRAAAMAASASSGLAQRELLRKLSE